VFVSLHVATWESSVAVTVGVILHFLQHLSHTLGVRCRVGIAPSTVEVRFQDLHIQAKVFVRARALPSVLNSCRNFFEVSVQQQSASPGCS